MAKFQGMSSNVPRQGRTRDLGRPAGALDTFQSNTGTPGIYTRRNAAIQTEQDARGLAAQASSAIQQPERPRAAIDLETGRNKVRLVDANRDRHYAIADAVMRDEFARQAMAQDQFNRDRQFALQSADQALRMDRNTFEQNMAMRQEQTAAIRDTRDFRYQAGRDTVGDRQFGETLRNQNIRDSSERYFEAGQSEKDRTFRASEGEKNRQSDERIAEGRVDAAGKLTTSMAYKLKNDYAKLRKDMVDEKKTDEEKAITREQMSEMEADYPELFAGKGASSAPREGYEIKGGSGFFDPNVPEEFSGALSDDEWSQFTSLSPAQQKAILNEWKSGQ